MMFLRSLLTCHIHKCWQYISVDISCLLFVSIN
uniref:Uncharacterized protein n=1 Tax=Arundo donax TaxID=35708 RepID=A0A0A8YSC7_ARUDO